MLVSSIALCSCIPVGTLHSIATPADTVWLRTWHGEWLCPPDSVDSGFVRLSFSEWNKLGDEHVVWMSFSDADGKECGEYALVPVQLGGRWFASAKLYSMMASLDSSEAEVAAVNFRLNYVVRLDTLADSLTLSYLSVRRLSSFLDSHHGWLEVRPGSANEKAIEVTSDTKRLRRFLETYANVDTLFEPAYWFRREPGR